MTKSLANRTTRKQRLYSFRITNDRNLLEKLDEYNKILDDSENVDISLENEDKAIIFLNALPKTFDQLRDAMVYGRERTITLDEVLSAVKTKLARNDADGKVNVHGESLSIKSKFDKNKQKKVYTAERKPLVHYKGKEPVQKETRICHHRKKVGHLRRDCFFWKKKLSQSGEFGSAEVVTDGEVLNVVDGEVESKWILDSGCSFHTCPHKRWFCEITKSCLGSVLPGNDEICPVEGIGKIKIRLHDGSVRVLTDVRYIPGLKRNLISLGTLEEKGCIFKSDNGVITVERDFKLILQWRETPNRSRGRFVS